MYNTNIKVKLFVYYLKACGKYRWRHIFTFVSLCIPKSSAFDQPQSPNISDILKNLKIRKFVKTCRNS